MDLVLNNLRRLICHKTQTTNQPFSSENSGSVALLLCCFYTQVHSEPICTICLDLIKGQIDLFKIMKYLLVSNDPIYPTPPLGQDMTQGQFLSGV